MAKRTKKKNNTKKIISRIIILAILIIIGYYLYYTYTKIEVNPQSEEKSKNVADILEKTMESVVGISKLKDNGSSIFSTNTETLLGLGTGVIISENGYILSNEHVTGAKYSTCYITLENSKKYDGTVVWSDSDLDLSSRGNGICNRKPNRFWV